MQLPFVGPAYTLATRQASAQDSVNLYLQGLETPSKAGFILRAAPGLLLFAALGGAIRGELEVGSREFVVAGNGLYEVYTNGTSTLRGTLNTSTGNVGMVWGTTQIVVVDGAYGYVFRLATNVFAQITDPDFPGSTMVRYLDGFFIFQAPGTQKFMASAIDDATVLDALDFASAESSPDSLVAHIVCNSRLYLLGALTTEVWFSSGGAFPFSRSNGETMDVGCIAPWSVVKADAGFFFCGRDENGSGIVYQVNGAAPKRVSNTPMEEALQSSTDISGATAWCYQDHGQTFYAINAPGVPATLVYEISTGAWHKRCELDANGYFAQGRVTHHMFAFGRHLVGDAIGNIYTMSRGYRTLSGDPLVCERTSPNDVVPLRQRQFFREFVLDIETGETDLASPFVELSWSDDGGRQFGNPVVRSCGTLGNRGVPLRWHRLGQARDRVWRTRFDARAARVIISGASA